MINQTNDLSGAPLTEMTFRVGPWVYAVKITEEVLFDDEGKVCDGLSVWSHRKIMISANVPVKQRLDLLLHELCHVWMMHFGYPANIESQCNWVSSFTTDAMRQFQAQGDEHALMRIEPCQAKAGERRLIDQKPTGAMKFRVAAYCYQLFLESDPIMHDGRDCQALAQSRGRKIRMSVEVPPGERLMILLHELRHCWGFHVPRPSTEEEECDLLAMIAEAAYADLEQQGGVKTLMKCRPQKAPSS